MEIAAFAEMTYGVLQDTPLRDFIPTLCLPEQQQVLALAGVPREKEEEVREIALAWAESKANGTEEFLIAFRDGEGYFRIIRRANGKLSEALYRERKKN
jgi:hypothetical protein